MIDLRLLKTRRRDTTRALIGEMTEETEIRTDIMIQETKEMRETREI